MKGALYSKKMIAYLRNILMDRRRRLAHAVEGGLPPMGGDRMKVGSDLLDAAIENSTQDLAFQMAAVGSNEVQSIDRALNRIDDGSYGLCNECGQAIAEARLRALPFAEMCVKCQAAYERHIKQEGGDVLGAADYAAVDLGGDSDSDLLPVKGRKVG